MFLNVFTQVLILIALISIGFISAKAGLITEEGSKVLTDIALIIATPCVIIKSLIREYSKETLKSLSVCFLFTFIIQLFMILLSNLIFHAKDKKRQNVLRFGTIFANCGFMSLPLQTALLGNDGVLYGSSYIIMFNMILWTYGIVLMSGDKKYISPKKLIINPGLIGFVIGILIFVLSIPVPKVLTSSIDYVSALYTPLPMFVIGYHLSKSNVLLAFKDVKCILAVLARLVLFPLIGLGLLYLLQVRGTMLVSITISISAPVAAITTMFSSKFDGDTPLSVNMVSLSTILCVITMPLIITVAQFIA